MRVFIVLLVLTAVNAQSEDTEECEYLDCNDYASACVRYSGVEYCDPNRCEDGQAGYLCDLKTRPCENLCQNNGTCFSERLTGGDYCVCQSGFTGEFCETEDETKKCGIVQDSEDLILLPTCSLKTTLTKLSDCINAQLPYFTPGNDAKGAEEECAKRVTLTKHCIYRTVRDCSRNLCPSIYDVGGEALYEAIAAQLYHPFSNFSIELRALLCSPPGENGTFEYPDKLYNIGAPVCGSDLIDDLLRTLTDWANNQQDNEPEMCTSLAQLRTDIYNEVDGSCDWSKINTSLSLVDPPEAPGYSEKVFETAQEFFLEWVVPGCGGECRYTTCANGGSCFRDESSGDEVCLCPSGTGGLLCNQPNVPCDEYECQNGGSCFNISGVTSCVCPPGFSGMQCQNVNVSKQCPTPDENDMIFLPTCTLKTTLERLSSCINIYLPFYYPYIGEVVQQCNANITRVKRCMSDVIDECSRTACRSAYEYGGLELYLDIAHQLYDPSSNFSKALIQELCVAPGDISNVYAPSYQIGAPVCQSNLIDRLLTILMNSTRNFPLLSPPAIFCPILDHLKYALYNETKARCDFAEINKTLTYLTDPEDMPRYWQKLLETAQEFFLEWKIIPCQGSLNPCDGYCHNGGFCTLNENAPFCSCPEYFGGARCELFDPTNVCPIPGQGDVSFLPLCTLRTTLNATFHCFADLALASGGMSDFNTCSEKIVPAFFCLSNLVLNCSRSTCPSIFLLPNAVDITQQFFRVLFDPEVINGVALYVCSPSVPGGYSQFLRPLVANISIPFCQQSFLGDLIDLLADVERNLIGITDLSQLCSSISEVLIKAASLIDECDFSSLGNYVPDLSEEAVNYLHTLIDTGRSILRNFTLPGCEGPGVVDGPCPVITSSTPQCQLADAWMCNYFQFRKSASAWGVQFVEWLEGCSEFGQRNWDDWASSMGLMRGDMNHWQMGSSFGVDGFVRMLKANVPCPTISAAECKGQTFTTADGCTICYNPGASRNVRDLISLYTQEFQSYQVVMRIYNALRENCSRSSVTCGGEASTTVPPMPTFTSAFSTVTFVPSSTPASAMTSGPRQDLTHSLP